MLASYLQRGVAAGAVAGIAYGLYMALVGNPLTAYVDAAASGHSHAHGGHDHAVGVVSETTTAAVSAGSGVLWGILLGGAFAVALYFLEPALPGRDAAKAYVLAGAGFLTVSGVPWLALPPAAPGARYAYGIDARIGLYLGFVVLGAVTAAAAVFAYRRGASRHVGVGLAAAAVPIAAVAAALLIAVPTVATHPGVPADLVAAYRGLAVLSQAGIWLLVAATFNGLRRRASVGDESPRVEPRGTTHP
jgi:hypothetical protein